MPTISAKDVQALRKASGAGMMDCKKALEATEVLTWKNTTSHPAPALRFHLYLNAFRNTLSTFWRESSGEHRDGALPDSWGSIEVTRMTGPDGVARFLKKAA